MAELFLKQGHSGRALSIYRNMVRDDPTDTTSAQRLAELETELASERGVTMGFRDHMENIIDSIPGARACFLMGFDGIPIDSVETGGGPIDVGILLTEYSATAQQARRAADELAEVGSDVGSIIEVAIAADNVTVVMRPLTSDYFMAVVLDVGGLAGKARYMMRVAAPQIVADLE